MKLALANHKCARCAVWRAQAQMHGVENWALLSVYLVIEWRREHTVGLNPPYRSMPLYHAATDDWR